jgi:hypothetical protein
MASPSSGDCGFKASDRDDQIRHLWILPSTCPLLVLLHELRISRPGGGQREEHEGIDHIDRDRSDWMRENRVGDRVQLS